MYCVTISLTPSVTLLRTGGIPSLFLRVTYIRTFKCDFIWVNNMTKAAFLLDLFSCPLVVFCCILSRVNLQPAWLQKERNPVQTVCVRVSVARHEGGRRTRRHYDPVPCEPHQHPCFCPPMMPAVYGSAWQFKNHSSAPSLSTALFVVRGDCVLPRILVGERSLHWSLTGFHSDDGGSSPQPLILNRTDFPLA